jgi:carboxylate-amine ligase
MGYNVGMAVPTKKMVFNSSERSSLGVEMELALVDKESRELKSGAIDILASMGAPHPNGEHPKAKHELLQSTVEIITGICSTVAEARADLAATLEELRPEAEARNLDLICAGSHPFSDWAKQEISPKERYHELIERYQWPARRLQIFGIHVHVGIRSPDKVIAIGNALCAYIPHFLALSASSPYWVGEDTGLASCRSKVFEGLPTAGLPYQLDGWHEFEEFMGTLIAAKAITTVREVWWDIRPHPRLRYRRGARLRRGADAARGERHRRPRPMPGRMDGPPDRPGLPDAEAPDVGHPGEQMARRPPRP